MLSPQTLETSVKSGNRRGYYDKLSRKNRLTLRNECKASLHISVFTNLRVTSKEYEAGETDKSEAMILTPIAHKARMKEHKKMLNKFLENLRALDAIDGSQLE